MLIIGKRQLLIILAIGVIATLFSVGVVIANKIIAKDFQRVKAIVVNISTERGASPRVDSSASYWITYEFSVDGKTFHAEKQVFTKGGRSIGDAEYIKYDPENPERIENTLAEWTGVALAVFFATFSVLLLLASRKR